MSARFALPIMLTAASVFFGGSALAENTRHEFPRGGYVEIDPGAPGVIQPEHVQSNIIYLNGCFNQGDCTFTPGADDSVNNRSQIIRGTVNLAPFDAGQVAWDAVVECVRATYEPFGVEITDVDPSPAPHFEAVVAGNPQQIGMSAGVGGVAPFSCGIIDNAVTYSFANIYGGFVPQICWTVAQETAHAFGLDHEFLCEDPMTYLQSCGPNKTFQNIDAPCGEGSARRCQCGGETQNSFRSIRDIFGNGTPTPPEVAVSEPRNGANVDKGYVIRATAEDRSGIKSVELYINGQLAGSTTLPPFVFNAPTDISDGVHNIEVRAFDGLDNPGSVFLTVTQGEPCGSASDCRDGETCVDGRCVAGPGTPGGLGEACGGNDDCVSGLCGTDDDGNGFCGEKCNPGSQGCPDGFGCFDSGEFGVCWPGYDDGGCGCRATGRTGAGTAALLVLAFAFGVGRRRRRRRR